MKESKPSANQRQAPRNQLRNNLPWTSLEQQVVRMQKQISQACMHGNKQAVHSLQQRLMESEAARLLAVRRVTKENQGRNTAGVDGVKSLTPEEQLAMASTIHPKNWKHQFPDPVRRVWVPKPGTAERRPLAILPMIDRCKQALVKLALEPEWEMRFEPHSYGFRPGRSTHDAIAAVVVAIERHPTFVFSADIEGAFDHVKQEVILEKLQTFPALRQAINAWLTAGIIDGNLVFSSETGIAQGGVLSPLLMNVALHGMETAVTEGTSSSQSKERPLLVRYADNFVILHSDLKELQQAVKSIRRWLARIGLHLHETHFAHTLTPYQEQIGFDFLGFNISQEFEEKIPKSQRGQKASFSSKVKVKTRVNPSEEASERHLASIDQRLQRLQTASQAQVIAELNPLIVGWVTYYNGIVEASVMGRYDDLIEQRLIHWASKRHPGKARDWLVNHYWRPVGERRKVFATHDGVQLRAYRQTSILGRHGQEMPRERGNSGRDKSSYEIW
jgi:RNA-directed DNA polymerase